MLPHDQWLATSAVIGVVVLGITLANCFLLLFLARQDNAIELLTIVLNYKIHFVRSFWDGLAKVFSIRRGPPSDSTEDKD